MAIGILLLVIAIIVVVAIANGNKRTTQPRWDEGSTTKPTQRDSFEGDFWEIARSHSSDAVLKITYSDAQHYLTERVVEVSGFGREGNRGYITGICRLRNEPRTFRYDRVRECIDVETGEVVEDIHAHLLAKYEASPMRSMDVMQSDNADILRVLFYVGKADGTLRAPERAVILDTCYRLTGDTRITDAMLQKVLRTMERPTQPAFQSAIARIKAHSVDKRALVVEAAERIVATQKTVHPDEVAAIDHMRAALVNAV